MHKKLLFRALEIFTVGMFLNVLGIIDNFSWEELRWTGTLHRVAIVFLVCGLLAGNLLLSKRPVEAKENLFFFRGFISFVMGIVWNWSFGLNENGKLRIQIHSRRFVVRN